MNRSVPSLLGVAALMLAGAGIPAPAVADASPAPPTLTAAPRALRPCAVSALSLREVGRVTPNPDSVVYAIKNDGPDACRVSPNVSIALVDPQGRAMRFERNHHMELGGFLTLEPGAEALFSISFEWYWRPENCRPIGRIEASLGDLGPLVTSASWKACSTGRVSVSFLRVDDSRGASRTVPTSAGLPFS